MTPTEKQKCIAEQAVYGDLKGLLNDKVYPIKWITSTLNVYYDRNVDDRFYRDLSDTTPILRPLSDLTKEITHRGYSDDKPFIPMLDWAKKQHPKYRKYKVIDGGVTCYDAPAGDTSWARCSLGYGLKSNEEMDYLNMLHFDSRKLLHSNEAISTDEVNPYEVHDNTELLTENKENKWQHIHYKQALKD